MTASPTLEGCVALSHWGVIRAQGADAASFLHSQLTNDIDHLRSDEARLAGYCSAKGRLLASFVVWKRSEDEILLACSADLLAATLKRLSMFVLRAKCKLSDASGEFAVFGLAGAAAVSWAAGAALTIPWGRAPHAGGDLLRLPDVDGAPRFLWFAPAGAPAPTLPALSADTWRWGEVASGVAQIEAATVDQFVPQMLNYEVLGGVDFKKGCYPGQEVVVRSQYRGTIKRRSFLFSTGAAEVRAGQEVFHSEDPGQPAGLVANAASAPQHGGLALVELKLAALQGGSLHLGAADGPLMQRAELPYALPADTA